MSTSTYLAAALVSGISLEALQLIPIGTVLDIIMIRSGASDVADIIDDDVATDSDLLGGY